MPSRPKHDCCSYIKYSYVIITAVHTIWVVTFVLPINTLCYELGKIEEFDVRSGKIDRYIERVEQYF